MLNKFLSPSHDRNKGEKIKLPETLLTIILLPFVFVLCNEVVSFSQSIFLLKGISSEDVHYTYTINQDFTGETLATVNVPILPSFDTPIQSQNSQNQTITYSIQPNTATHLSDEAGNRYIKAEWTTPVTSHINPT